MMKTANSLAGYIALLRQLALLCKVGSAIVAAIARLKIIYSKSSFNIINALLTFLIYFAYNYNYCPTNLKIIYQYMILSLVTTLNIIGKRGSPISKIRKASYRTVVPTHTENFTSLAQLKSV